MFVRAYLDTAALILDQYHGEEPLPSFLKKFFAANKKFGSRDRRQISHLCYCYFRLGHAMKDTPVQERLLVALFLCSDVAQPVLAQLAPEWNALAASTLKEKMALLAERYPFQLEEIFPFTHCLSDAIEQAPFVQSFLVQPDTYLRLRPGKEKKVKAQLNDAGIDFYTVVPNCIGLPPAAKLDELLMLNRDAVVQDKSSQQVLSLLEPHFPDRKTAFSSWDCCAASGGKSLLLHDLYPNARITVSDIRSSIIVNLKKRFAAAGISDYHSFVGDIGAPEFSCNQSFQLVICDAPCSGSGTWGRTPEQLYFFTEEKINHYAALQKRIAVRAAKQVTKGGVLLYITCSVFKAENEEVVAHISQETGMQPVGTQYFKGYGQKADTLFAAAFKAL
ncbi:16S rRNA (cytosine967-C5)-methyltransferase [Cnuella takakiae]|uniref:16S rRNA (Cytosine967-C5)-methyltransferase n=1 Tax=Cnuella takakiae TaxID=1302690 RepID=A0A1M5I9J3_9BACT|nr:hypothetical protein [Cnuella takakiae]OLY93214.1 hypothetical protein BUE76_15950 [Cnuella takakiae]SHG24453.1 16S rRNA (cytosine967-C5)-methyltransferase [Cnuella takakiae]